MKRSGVSLLSAFLKKKRNRKIKEIQKKTLQYLTEF